MNDLNLAVHNAAVFWTIVGQARGDEVVSRPGFVAVSGSERTGMRVLLLTPDPDPDEVAEIKALVRQREGGHVTVEDAYGSIDASDLGLTARLLPVMIRQPEPILPPPVLDVIQAETPEQLKTVESVVVHGFPLERYQPYRAGEVLPGELLTNPGTEFFLVERNRETAGVGLAVLDGTVAGLYWVTTMPEHRSQGVARAFMHGVLRHLKDLPVTLSASKAGKPLYDSLGFTTLTEATWWS